MLSELTADWQDLKTWWHSRGIDKIRGNARSFAEELLINFSLLNECPCCQTRGEFYEGPRGGMSVNIMCFACGARFNMTGMPSGFSKYPMLDWTHGPQPNLWDKNRKPTKFPDVDRDKLVEEALSR